MTMPHHWVETTGGPHLLLDAELATYWRGVDGWFDNEDPSDQSDYARACRINDWLGHAPCHTGQALVMSGDVGPIAWWPTDVTPTGLSQEGYFVQWLGVDDEQEIASALRSNQVSELLQSDTAERSEFKTGETGRMLLFDAADAGAELLVDHAYIDFRPGNYKIRANYLETSTMMIVLRQVNYCE